MEFPYISVRELADGSVVVAGKTSASFGFPVQFGGQKAGIFANWHWIADKRELRAEVDPYGLFNLFYSKTSDGIMLSTSPIQLIALGAKPNLDHTALAVFHLIGWFIDDETPFSHIRVLPPDGHLLWSNGQMSITGRNEFTKPRPIKRDAAIDEYGRLFSKSIQACATATKKPLVIPLSGGRDSRHLMLETHRLGIPIDHCATMDHTLGKGLDPDFTCASQVAQYLGVRHVRIEAHWGRHADQIQTHCLTHLCSDENVQAISMARYLKGQEVSIFDGLAGDILSRNKGFTNHLISEMLKEGNAKTAAKEIFAGHNKITGTSAQERAGQQLETLAAFDAATDRVAALLDSYGATADAYSQFLFWTRTRREVGLMPSAILSSVAEAFLPYCSPELVEFCSSLPMEVTADGKFHDHIINHNFPHMKEVPYQDEIKGSVYRRFSIVEKLTMIAEDVLDTRTLGFSNMLAEPWHQGRMLVDHRHRNLARWRTYCLAMNWMRDEKSAQSYLRKQRPLL